MAVFQFGSNTKSFGTIITEVVPPLANHIPRITSLGYSTSTTAHTLTVMRCLATTTATALGNDGDTALEVANPQAFDDSTGTPEDLAANDFIVFETKEGTFELGMVGSISGSVLTLSANKVGSVAIGATVWLMGEVGRVANQQVTTVASGTQEFSNLRWQGGVPGTLDAYNTRTGAGDPIVFHSNNATADGHLRHLSGVYVASTDVTMT